MTRTFSGISKLLLFTILLAVGMTLKDIPLTKHAMESHSEQVFNAPVIQKFMSKGGCKLYAQWCSDETFRITCRNKLEKDQCIGLVVACNPLQIVTGFEGRCKYWQSIREGCTIPVPVPSKFLFLN